MTNEPISREAKLLIQLGEIQSQLWKARDRSWKLGRERNHWKRESLLQARLLAMSDVREERLRTQTGYWESLIRWLEQTQEAHKGQDRDWDLTQVYMRGPFAGWSQSDMVKLADKLWENEQKHPLRGDRK